MVQTAWSLFQELSDPLDCITFFDDHAYCFSAVLKCLLFVFRLEATKSAILPELVELTNDEESFVRLAGLETVVNVLGVLDDGKPA